MYTVELYAAVRQLVLVEGRSGACFWAEPRDDLKDVPVFGGVWLRA
jgi:hypothetical protein